MTAPDPASVSSSRLGKLLAMLERDPEDAFCLYGVAQEHAKAGRHLVAVEWFNRALASDPDSSYAYFHKARSLEELKQRADAVSVLRAGLAAARRVRDSHAEAEIAGFLDELDAGETE